MNTNEAHVTYIARATYPVFDYFTHKVFSHEIGAMKPDRRIYERYDCAVGETGRRRCSLSTIVRKMYWPHVNLEFTRISLYLNQLWFLARCANAGQTSTEFA